jgi:outer membrane protein TolC
MKSKILVFCTISTFSVSILIAQNTTLTLKQAVEMALQNSDESNISKAKLTSAEHALNVTKNLQYPDAKISGQYMYLANANANLKLNLNEGDPNNGGSPSNASPKINQLLLGQASIAMPIFSGFKLKNTLKAAENQFQAASYNAKNDTERIALNVILDYLKLYKAQQSITLVEDNLKSAQQRVKDFLAMEQNGLLARNDLLKAELQESNIEVSLEEAKKNKRILNYKLAVLLKLPENTTIETEATNFGLVKTKITAPAIERNDLEALQYQKQAAENQIKTAQSKYYPSLSLSGGYIALNLQNALTVTNAMNIGLGLSYNLSDIFKAKSDIKLAKSKAKELQYTIDAFSDKIKVEIENARQEYQLAIKKFEVFIKSKEQATENFRIVKDKYNNGLADTNDLLDADVSQLQAKINLAYAKANITQKYYELLSAQGQLTNTLSK